MAKAVDLGFLEGIIFEAIVSTYNDDGTSNAAPMGIMVENDSSILLNVFDTSTTNHNLKNKKCAVINLTNNVETFYKTAFKEANPNGKLPSEWFEEAQTVNAPRLRSSDATIEISVTNIKPEGPDRTKFLCSIAHISAQKKYPQVYCRAVSATIEAITDATRVKVFVNDIKKRKEVNELLARIRNRQDLVTRVAPDSVYSETFVDLIKKIDLWRTNP